MSKGGSAPTPTSATDIADAATKSNQQIAGYQAGLNAVNQVNPFGSLTYTMTPGKDGGPPQYTATTSLSKPQRGILSSQQGAQQQLASEAQQQATALNHGGLSNINAPQYQNYGSGPNLQNNVNAGHVQNSIADAGSITRGIANAGQVTGSIANAGNIQRSLGTNDFSGDRQHVEDALLGELNTQSDRDMSSLQTRLANQGIQVGSDAYTRAMGDFNKNLTQNRTSAILNAGSEQNRLQNLALNAGNFVNSAQAQQYGQNSNNSAFANQAQNQRYAQNSGNAAFINAAQSQQFGQNQAQQQANNSAQAQQFGQGMANAQLNNSSLQQQYANQTNATQLNNANATQGFQNNISANNQRLNQLAGLMSGAQVQNPAFASTPQTGVAGVDTAGIYNNAYNQQYQQYQNQQQQGNSLLGGLFGLGASALTAFSDRRLKRDIERAGSLPNGLPVYSYRYLWDDEPTLGVMADEVLHVKPEAVSVHPSGYMLVDYSMILGEH
jgi:hypothetical protein